MVLHPGMTSEQTAAIGGSTYKFFWLTLPPPWDSVLSLSHKFSPKSNHVGGPCPPQNGSMSPTGNPRSAPGYGGTV